MPCGTLSEALLPAQGLVQPRGQLPKLSGHEKKDGKRLKSRRSKKKQLNESKSLRKSKSSVSGVVENSTKNVDSLRWEGEVKDPKAEEKRLELYKVNRRHRYNAHREAVLKDLQGEGKGKKAVTENDLEVDASFIHMTLN